MKPIFRASTLLALAMTVIGVLWVVVSLVTTGVLGILGLLLTAAAMFVLAYDLFAGIKLFNLKRFGDSYDIGIARLAPPPSKNWRLWIGRVECTYTSEDEIEHTILSRVHVMVDTDDLQAIVHVDVEDLSIYEIELFTGRE